MNSYSLPTVLKIFIFIWLLVCTYFDLKSREVPNLLTIFPLILSALFALVFKNWEQVIYVVFLFIIADFPDEFHLPCGILGLFLGILCFPEQIFLLTAYFLFWSLWEFELMGGADVKILITILLITQAQNLSLYILIAGGIIGLVYLLKKEKTFPFSLAITGGTTIFLFTTSI